jgi:hypothetical protein
MKARVWSNSYTNIITVIQKSMKTPPEEYKLQHPSWFVNKVVDYKMDCDFKAMYGDAFSVLILQPTAVFIAEGSLVGIEWKRNRLNFDYERS